MRWMITDIHRKQVLVHVKVEIAVQIVEVLLVLVFMHIKEVLKVCYFEI